MVDPGRVPSTLLAIRGQDENNDEHRDPEHIKEPDGGEEIDKWRGEESTCLEAHLHTMTGHSTRGTMQL